MKNVVLFLIFSITLIFSSHSTLAQEIPLRKTRDFYVANQTWQAHFVKRDGRTCYVDLCKVEKGHGMSCDHHVNFDFARGEETVWIDGVKVTIFHVEKGVIVLVNGIEI